MTGAELRNLRISLGESYAKFAERFGVTRQTIYQWEKRGTPTHGAAKHHVNRVLLLMERFWTGKVAASPGPQVD